MTACTKARRGSLSFGAKLALSFVGLSLVVITVVGVILTTLNNDHAMTALRDKARLYARLLEPQLRTVVAFNDKLTASEIFESFGADAEVAGLAVYAATGDPIATYGSVPEALRDGRPSGKVDSGLVVVLASIVSPEGPRGNLYLSLTTRAVTSYRDRSTVTALAIAAGALVLAIAIAWAISRAVTHRLRRISDAAKRVSDGDLSQPDVPPGAADEIGALTSAFNAMVSELRRQFAQLEQLAATEHARLEAIVATRTAQLAQHNRSAMLLNEFGEELHSGLALQEACEVIGRHLPRLLPETAGALFMFEASRSSAAIAAQWGSPAGIGEISAPNDCRSLDRRDLHNVSDSAKAQNCRHFRGELPRHYSCVPLSAQGELIGVLHVQRGQHSSSHFSDAEMYLVKAVREHARLALANLKLRDALRDQSIRDHLTGLYNRRNLEESLDRELARARRGNHSVAVFMLDADHFKRINDRFGHETGDVVLRALARVIKESCRANDLPCRFGGEEFTVVLTECRREDAVRWGERLLARIGTLEVNSGGVGVGRITVSIGLALFPEDGEDIETLLQAADIALYKAKQSGRDRLVAYQGMASGPGPAGANAIPAVLRARP